MRESGGQVNPWPARLHVVTGKGGTGKTSVAAALALALATEGGRTLLVEVEDRQGIAQLFDVPPLPYEERRIASAPDGGEVRALAVEPKAALLEYLELFYHLGRAGRMLEKIGAIDFATTIAPGVRDVLLTGKVYEAVQRPRGGRRGNQITYDAVVLDAPPTGRIGQFLGVNSELAGLAKVGPIKSQADNIMNLLRSPHTAVHLVTILEEMPVQETSDGIAELRAAGLPVGGVVVNLVRPQALRAAALAQVRDDEVDPTAIASELSRAKVDVDADLVTSLVAEARDHAVRPQLEDEQRALVAAEDLPTYELPRLSGGIDRGALLELAQLLRQQGMA